MSTYPACRDCKWFDNNPLEGRMCQRPRGRQQVFDPAQGEYISRPLYHFRYIVWERSADPYMAMEITDPCGVQGKHFWPKDKEFIPPIEPEFIVKVTEGKVTPTPWWRIWK